MKQGGGRAKGKGFERLISKQLTEYFGHKFAATPASGGLRWKGIKNTRGDIVTDMPGWKWCIECKKDESWTLDNFVTMPPKHPIKQWWYQCCRDAKAIGKKPLLIFTKNHRPIYAMVPRMPYMAHDNNNIWMTIDDERIEKLDNEFASVVIMSWFDMLELL